MSRKAHDLLDGSARLSLLFDGSIGFLTPQISFILDALGGGKQVRIDGRSADGGADLAHGFANRVEEGVAGVFHKVPTIGDLGGVRQRLRRR